MEGPDASPAWPAAKAVPAGPELQVTTDLGHGQTGPGSGPRTPLLPGSLHLFGSSDITLLGVARLTTRKSPDVLPHRPRPFSATTKLLPLPRKPPVTVPPGPGHLLPAACLKHPQSSPCYEGPTCPGAWELVGREPHPVDLHVPSTRSNSGHMVSVC